MLKLTASLTPDALTLPIVEKAVSFEGIDMAVSIETSIDKNSKKMLGGLFDIAEMSFATFLRARMDGLPLVALPLFTGRRFTHPAVFCSRAGQIRGLEDLIGKRIGVPQYWMTSSVWHRGILQEHYGISQDQVTWVTTASERLESLTSPANVAVERAPAGSTLPELLDGGSVDCLMLPKAPQRTSDWASPFPDTERAQIDYYRASRVLPIMHLVVMSERVATEHPDLPSRLIGGFAAAKRLARRQKPIATLSDQDSEEIFGADPWPYGIDENWPSISVFLGYARAQGLLDRALRPEDLFVGLDR